MSPFAVELMRDRASLWAGNGAAEIAGRIYDEVGQ